MRLLGLLIFGIFINSVASDIPIYVNGRYTGPYISLKECIILKSPRRMLKGLVEEYSRRTEEATILRTLNHIETMYMDTLELSVTNETSWKDAAVFTRTLLQEVNDRLQKIYNENPGIWNPPFPNMNGFYRENVQERLKEVYDDIGKCYMGLTPCSLGDIKCHFRWLVLGELTE